MAKSQSLAASAGVLTEELRLPAVFQEAPMEPVKARRIAPYICFAHPKRADEWKRLVDKFNNVEEGEMFLIHPDYVKKLQTAKLAWICHRQYWANSNAGGELLQASYKEMPRPWKEHVEAVVLVYFDDNIVPANVSFRSTKCPAAKVMSEAYAEACKPEWGEKSQTHKETLVCAQPFMRFFGEVTLGPQRIGKGTGLPYRPTVCIVKPTTLPDWRLLKALISDEKTQKALDDAAARFQWRLDELQGKLV